MALNNSTEKLWKCSHWKCTIVILIDILQLIYVSPYGAEPGGGHIALLLKLSGRE